MKFAKKVKKLKKIKKLIYSKHDLQFSKSLCLIATYNKYFQTIIKNGQVNEQASADRPVSSLLGLIRSLQLVLVVIVYKLIINTLSSIHLGHDSLSAAVSAQQMQCLYKFFEVMFIAVASQLQGSVLFVLYLKFK